jgi:hypothetical protein
MRRKLLIGAGALALLVALYGAAGYWLAPGYLRETLAELAAEHGYRLELGKVRTQPFALRAEFEAVVLRTSDGRVLAAAQSASAKLSWASLWRRGWLYEATARLADGGHVATRGQLTRSPLAAEGLVTVSALNAAQLAAAAKGELHGEARYVYAEERLSLHDVKLDAKDLVYEGIVLPQATLRAGEIPVVPAAAFQLSAQASVAPQGKVAAQGRMQLAPFELRAEIDAAGLPLAQAQRWLPKDAALRLVSGAVSGKGLLRIEPSRTTYQGSVALRGLHIDERATGALLLAWQHAETGSLEFASSPPRIAAGEIVVRAPEGRLVIAQDGSVNFAAAFGAGAGEGGGEPLRASVQRLRVEEGTLHFADRSLANPFEVTIRELSGAVTGIASGTKAEPARVRLNGRVLPYGVARIQGTLDLDAPTNRADIRASLRNLRLEAFNPYVAKFAGYRIESGRLSADLRYEVREGRVVGANKLAFENMQLGEKLEEKGLLDLPLELAVALLADSKGRIDLEVPVRGNLNDPQFDMGAIVARAVGNVLKRIVSAPFRALAGLFGGDDEDPGGVAFAPGSAELSPPAEEKVAQLAQALGQRPQLGLEVRGAYDPARDLEGLRMRTARQDVARAAGQKGSPDLSDARTVRAMEKLYLERGGDRQTMSVLRKENERYARALLRQIAFLSVVDSDAAQALAYDRAEAVRSGLVEHGIDPARVRVGDAVEKEASEREVVAELALTTTSASSAAAGASRR